MCHNEYDHTDSNVAQNSTDNWRFTGNTSLGQFDKD